MQKFLFGLDIGGINIKAGIFTKNGVLLGISKVKNQIVIPKPDWAEIPAEHSWENLPFLVKDSCRNADINPEDISTVGICSTCPTLVPLDSNGNPLRNAIMNFDQRSYNLVSKLQSNINMDEIFEITGNRILSGAISVSSILWIKENEPQIYEKTYCFGNITTYLIYKLTGRFILDYNQASFTGLFNTKNNFSWNSEIIQKYGLERDKLPELSPPTRAAGAVTREASGITQLKEDVLVAPGSADTVCSALGIGLVESTKIFISSGTSEIVSACLNKPIFDNRFLSRFYIDNLWIFHAATSTSGAAIKWLKSIIDYNNNIIDEEFFNLMVSLAKKSKIGSNKLLFLPYLQGERSPWWDSSARGVFFGLSMGTTISDICMSTFESIGFALKQNIRIAEELIGEETDEIFFTGGGSKNSFWIQVKSDITGKTLNVVDFNETAMLGAAILGGICGGIFKDHLDAINNIRQKGFFKIKPNLANYRKYGKLSNIFDSLYGSLKTEFKVLNELKLGNQTKIVEN
jgi:xylulokinase